MFKAWTFPNLEVLQWELLQRFYLVYEYSLICLKPVSDSMVSLDREDRKSFFIPLINIDYKSKPRDLHFSGA